MIVNVPSRATDGFFATLLDELAVIKKNLSFLTAMHRPAIQEILEFEKKYRQQVASRHGYIIPPHFDVARRIPIEQIFVPPSFVRPPRRKGEEPKSLDIDVFLSSIYRAVLLGNPGGGKSTLATKLCYDLATRYPERLFAGRQVTSILVILRDYGAEKKSRNCSILQFMETLANSTYQVQPPPSAFEYMLLNGRAIVIFDGLDELLDTRYRQEVSNDVESFCNVYPSVPVLVTSREVGYEQAPLDEERFEIFKLAPFDDNQTENYVTKWFAVDSDLTHEQQRSKAATFLGESRNVPDLRSNPLMLALMCNIYRGENYIPRNRPDLYEKCAVMLFERWDKSRGIYVPLPFEVHIRPAMMYLAYWIYTSAALQGGVTERSLILKATEYLCPRRFEDRDEAEKAAREFIDFCKGRAWVFTDTGTTKEGERLYQFTHRTFLEYFAAAHLNRIHPTPDKLAAVLFPKISKREWDVVAQLAFQLQNKNVEGAGDELLTLLITKAQETNNGKSWNLLSFAARCLEFIVPSPKVTRGITTACVEQCLVWGSARAGQKELFAVGRVEERSKPRELLGPLLISATENRGTVASSLEKSLIERINKGSEHESVLALDISLHLRFSLSLESREGDLESFWNGVTDRIFETCFERINELASRYYLPCEEAWFREKVSIGYLVKCHGVQNIFRDHDSALFQVIWWPPETRLILPLISSSSPEHVEKRLLDLREVGAILSSAPTPWITGEASRSPSIDWLLESSRAEHAKRDMAKEPSLDAEALFGAFLLFAAMLEQSFALRGHPKIVDRIKKSGAILFDFMRSIFLARFEVLEIDNAQVEMDRCGFKAEQQIFAWRWIRREVDLAKPTEPKVIKPSSRAALKRKRMRTSSKSTRAQRGRKPT